VLDNSAILYTNELSDGRLHSFMDLPYFIAVSAPVWRGPVSTA
jgi:hypothetical protein